ncbi:PREDICTED: uncharacterized protein LOC106745613 isoform X2 [Dinoponera quadriceps]|uniref:Uncharacterized protein LOC106745613 isoform X2 n=1 Tax=Dinoponera quadriceps TaxID=609295 RepID=A0A6P3XEG3_DINQU|nr:PREDICTED: uncharacterized protein LOC106745613 isoform X2 [Dinoponera quadriceps]
MYDRRYATDGDGPVNIMFPTYDEPSAFPFGVPSDGTHRVFATAHTSRSVTENSRHGCFNAERSPFVGHTGYYHDHVAPVGVRTVTGRLPSAMGARDSLGNVPLEVRQERMDVDVPQPFRKNHKRPGQCELYDTAAVKRLRRETGNGHIHRETENTRTCGMDQMHNLSSSICLNITGHYQSYFLPADKSSSTDDPGCKYISSNNNSKSNRNDTEYERMLFETHGCSIYHHQRIQSLDHIETEF